MDFERYRHHLRLNALGHLLKLVQIERLADVIAGKIFDCRVERQLVDACLPRFAWRKAPFGFLPRDIDCP